MNAVVDLERLLKLRLAVARHGEQTIDAPSGAATPGDGCMAFARSDEPGIGSGKNVRRRNPAVRGRVSMYKAADPTGQKQIPAEHR